MYRTSQIRYDPFFNEWDCCRDFQFSDPQHDSDDDDDDDWDVPRPNSPVVVEGEHAQVPSVDDSTQDDIGDDATPDLFDYLASGWPIQQEVEEVLGRYYGFCPPVIGIPLPEGMVDKRTADLFVRLLGSGRNDHGPITEKEYIESTHYQAAQLFVDGIVNGKRYGEVLNDTMEASWRPVRLLPRFRTIVTLDLRQVPKDSECLDNGEKLYLFNFGASECTVPWKLAMYSAITALLVCRLPSDYNETAIVYYLAQRGIPFRILHPRPRLTKLPRKPVVHEIPQRRWDHHFTREDYESYINNQTYLLGQPQMQVMLRRGGIAWRLSIACLGIGEVAKDPTMWGHQFAPTEGLIEDTATT
ncbi:hypothetical protein EST38_g13885, partial [Candolleomyces aberdarensis]